MFKRKEKELANIKKSKQKTAAQSAKPSMAQAKKTASSIPTNKITTQKMAAKIKAKQAKASRVKHEKVARFGLLSLFTLSRAKKTAKSTNQDGKSSKIGKAGKTEKDSAAIDKIEAKKAYLTSANSIDVLCDKNYFRFFQFSTYAFIGLIIILAFVILHLVTSRPNIKFFSVNPQNKSQPISRVNAIANDSDIIGNGIIQEFVLNAIPNAFTFDFNNYDYVLTHQLPRYFDDSAAEEISAFLRKKYVDDLRKYKQFFNISVIKSFVFEKGRTSNGYINEWRVQVPAKITINGQDSEQFSNIKFHFVIKYTGNSSNAYGLTITKVRIDSSRQRGV
ncbi:DotI/IcmL/TraM family protein [Cysteiniphilum marinum]|uniref:DotI/IcmL/TraM family protein n=1 Tax=Cysteiniphilum marinum TaxID=2774191 RepID=UPI00193BDB85|nr:DotI/IcmL/TraM family protein [Cysteiniphilum marinum]